MTGSRNGWIDAAWVLVVGLASSAWCLTAGQVVGPTFDEPAHLNAGLIAWRTGSIKQLMTWGAMPLPIDIQTLPIYIWERWRGEEFQPIAEMDRLLPVARAASLVFWWVLLIYGYRWGRLLGGPWAGRLACTSMAVDPNLLGHASLATTDICLTAAVLAATYHFAANRESGWLWRVFVPGILYGVALTAKASAMPYVPLLAVVFGGHHLWRTGQLFNAECGTRNAESKPEPGAASDSDFHSALRIPHSALLWSRLKELQTKTSRLRWDLLYVMLIGFVWVFAYCGCDWTTEPTFIDWAKKLPDGAMKTFMVPVSEHLKIFTNAGEGLVQQIKHNIRGHGGAYLLGSYHPRAVWYYFPLALTVKLADPTLVLFGVVLLTRLRTLLRSPAGWAAIVLLLFSLNTRVQIGVRLVFPLVCFSMIAVSTAIFAEPRGRKWLAGLAWLVVGLTAIQSAAIWPDGVRFVNQLHGGPDTGWKHVADSNYDWGQGMPDLKAWWQAHDDQPMAVWYYGGDPAVLLTPFRAVHLHGEPDKSPAGLRKVVGNGHLAVSIGLLVACPDRKPETLKMIDWLNSLEPVGRTPMFVIYRLP